MSIFQTVWFALTYNYLFLANSTVFFFAAIAILRRLYELTQLAHSGPKKIITSFFALCITALIIFIITVLVIASNDSLRWQLGFFIWLVYISAILIIFTIVEALFSFEPSSTPHPIGRVVSKTGRPALLAAAGAGLSYSYDLFGALVAIDFYMLISGLKEVGSTFNFNLQIPTGDTNLFKQLRYGLGHTPRLFIISGVLQGLCLAIVVKLLRIPPEKTA